MLPKNQEWYSWENLISGGKFATPTELDHDYELMKPVFFLVETKRLKENLINSVAYCKTKKHSTMSVRDIFALCYTLRHGVM